MKNNNEIKLCYFLNITDGLVVASVIGKGISLKAVETPAAHVDISPSHAEANKLSEKRSRNAGNLSQPWNLNSCSIKPEFGDTTGRFD
jgi:hypothetical protein